MVTSTLKPIFLALSILVLIAVLPASLLAQTPGQQAPLAGAAEQPVNGYAETLAPNKRSATQGAKVQSYNPIRKPDDEGQIPEIEMFVGESRVFPAPGVARIAVGNGSILSAASLDGREVILFANGVGTSSLFVWNSDGRYQRIKISIVPGDTTRYAREVAAFLSTIPKAKASVVGANIIVEGDEMSDADHRKIEALSKRYPQIVNFTNRVGWEQMVMLDVKVVEFPVTALREIGLKWAATGGGAVGAIWQPGRRGGDGPYQINILAGSNNPPPITSSDSGPVHLPSGLNALSVLNLGLNAQLNLLAQEGKAAVLAEPQLSTRNGSKASFLAGGEIPYAFSTRDGVFVQFKTYGVKLDISPQVDLNGVIRATIQAEVSSIDRSITTAGGPALLSRKTDTEFNVRNGETIVLSGLLQREVSTDIDKVPGLGDVPILGALFRSKRFQNKETELVVFVTPTVVASQSAGNVNRIQSTSERLRERLGASPYLSDPLQPGVSYQHPDLVDETSPVSGPSPRGPSDPAGLGIPRALTLPDPPRSSAQQYQVVQDQLPMFVTPDMNGDVMHKLALGQLVTALPQPARGAWLAVQFGPNESGQRGWVDSRLLKAVVGRE
jgi:pilus assembly protein CpaC